MGEVGRIVFHIWLPGGGECPRDEIDIVLLFCGIALHVKDDVLAYLHVLRPPLGLEHRRQSGVVDVAHVLPPDIVVKEGPIRVPGRRNAAIRQALELALRRGRGVGAKLLELQLGRYADVFEKALDQLRGVIAPKPPEQQGGYLIVPAPPSSPEEFLAEEEERNKDKVEPGTEVNVEAEEFAKAVRGEPSRLGKALLAFHCKYRG